MANLPKVTNLLNQTSGGEETFTSLLKTNDVQLEHIVSNGQASERGFWYDQDQTEWVSLIQGKAELEFEHACLQLKAGDSLTIPAHCKHRVRSVSLDAVWLALHTPAHDKDPIPPSQSK